jgi:hypothetical protein
MLAVFGVVQTGSLDRAAEADRVKDVVAMPGTGLSAMTPQQAAELARCVEKVLAGSGQKMGLDQFVNGFREMRRTGAARERHVCTGGRTVEDVCREMGKVMLRQQELERQGRASQVANFVDKLHKARENGVPEVEVQKMARDGLRRGKLSLCASVECERMQRRLDDLVRQLVAAEREITGTHRPDVFAGPVQVSGR